MKDPFRTSHQQSQDLPHGQVLRLRKQVGSSLLPPTDRKRKPGAPAGTPPQKKPTRVQPNRSAKEEAQRQRDASTNRKKGPVSEQSGTSATNLSARSQNTSDMGPPSASSTPKATGGTYAEKASSESATSHSTGPSEGSAKSSKPKDIPPPPTLKQLHDDLFMTRTQGGYVPVEKKMRSVRQTHYQPPVEKRTGFHSGDQVAGSSSRATTEREEPYPALSSQRTAQEPSLKALQVLTRPSAPAERRVPEPIEPAPELLDETYKDKDFTQLTDLDCLSWNDDSATALPGATAPDVIEQRISGFLTSEKPPVTGPIPRIVEGDRKAIAWAKLKFQKLADYRYEDGVLATKKRDPDQALDLCYTHGNAAAAQAREARHLESWYRVKVVPALSEELRRANAESNQYATALSQSFEKQKILEQQAEYLQKRKDAETKRAKLLLSTLKRCKTQAQDLGERIKANERDLRAAVEYSEARDGICDQAAQILEAQPELLAGYRRRASREEAAAESLRAFVASSQKYLDEMQRHPVEQDREAVQRREAEMRRILGQAVKGDVRRPRQAELRDSTAPAGTVTDNVLRVVEDALRNLRLERERRLVADLPAYYAEADDLLNQSVKGMTEVGAFNHLGRVSNEMAVLFGDPDVQRRPDSEDAGQRRDVGQEEESGVDPHLGAHSMEIDTDLQEEAKNTDLPDDDEEIDDECYYEIQK